MARQMFNEKYPCPLCERLHSIRECSQFLVLPIPTKRQKVVELGLCGNCLAQSHRRPNCISKDVCRLCKKNHHSLLHPMDPKHFWFPMTAMVRFSNGTTQGRELRLVIDPSVPRSTITLEAAERCRCSVRQGYTTVTLKHRLHDREPIEVRCLVLDKEFGFTPERLINREWAMHHPVAGNTNAADIWWFKPYRYFMILGADVSGKVFRGGGSMGKAGETFIQNTIFGPAYFGEAKEQLD